MSSCKVSIAGIVVVLATLVAVVICVRIEMLNAAAGHVLPIPEEAGKWRGSSMSALDAYAARMNWSAAKLVEEKEKATANNRLRDWVSSAGLLQYPMVLIGLGLALRGAVTAKGGKTRGWYSVCVVFLTFCGVMAVYRRYFDSVLR